MEIIILLKLGAPTGSPGALIGVIVAKFVRLSLCIPVWETLFSLTIWYEKLCKFLVPLQFGGNY